MYKLLVLDMDGTLLNDQQMISDKNKIAIKKAKDKGVRIVIATGRAKPGIDPYLEDLDLIDADDYSVVCSGALVTNNINEVVSSDFLSQDDFNEILKVANNLNITLNIYSDNGILVNDDNHYSKFDAIANNLPLIKVDFTNLPKDTSIIKVMLINEDLSTAKELNDYFPNMSVEHPTFLARDNFNPNLFDNIDNLPESLLNNFNVSKVTKYNVEISNKKANKRNGIKHIADSLNIKPKEIICIGDSGNDRQMIKYAGLGVAMGNAFPEIKEIADFVADTNENSGVAQVIEKFILSRK